MNVSGDQLRTSVIEYCALIGKDPLLVQGAGGNVSWKDGDTLWVKASGTWLADAAEKDVFVPVDLKHLRSAIHTGDFSVTPRVLGESTLRPSIETLLHALMPHPVVLHLHAVEVLAHMVRKNCETDIQSLIGDLLSWVMVDYHKPGEPLAAAVSVALTKNPRAKVIFLKNHGVIIAGENVGAVNKDLHMLTSKLNFSEKQAINVTKSTEYRDLGVVEGYIPVDIPGIHILACNPFFYNILPHVWALYPDHVIFLGKNPVCFDYNKARKQAKFIDNNELLAPELIFIKGIGVFYRQGFTMSMLVQLKCYYDVMSRQVQYTNLDVLDELQIEELLNWDAEGYRQNIAKQ